MGWECQLLQLMEQEEKWALADANQKRFRFTAVEGQAVVTKPAVQSRQAVRE